jgi:hypothetical protein
MKIKIIFLLFCLGVNVVNAQKNLKPQNINFTEFVGDIPNPDRGFTLRAPAVLFRAPVEHKDLDHAPD